ncbi:MAG: hypothetical protein AAF892_11220 [Cyanobacteria bacterium P01_D01_bin.71]
MMTGDRIDERQNGHRLRVMAWFTIAMGGLIRIIQYGFNRSPYYAD